MKIPTWLFVILVIGCLISIWGIINTTFDFLDYTSEKEKAFASCVENLEISLIDNVICYNNATFPEAFDYIENSNISEQILEAVAT